MRMGWRKCHDDYVCNTPTGCIMQTEDSSVFVPGVHAVQEDDGWHWREIHPSSLTAYADLSRERDEWRARAEAAERDAEAAGEELADMHRDAELDHECTASATLREIARKILRSDALATAHPVYAVQEWQEVPVGEDGYASDHPGEEISDLNGGDDFPDVRRIIMDEEGFEVDACDVTSSDRIVLLFGSWRTVAACLSREGADDYIRQNQHNHGRLRVYVESAHANAEIRALRDALIALHGTHKEEDE